MPPQAPAPAPMHWHALPQSVVLQQLHSQEHGLSGSDALQRLQEHGPNTLPPPRTRAAWQRLLAQFGNLLILVLIVTALISFALQHWLDGTVILAVVVFNALIGFIQEGRAEKALRAIQSLLSPKAVVLRAGVRETVSVADLVPGDIVLLEAGDRVPADLRLLHLRGLHIDEAPLTGESIPVEKTLSPLAEKAALADRTNLAFGGTLVTQGTGRGVVIATGPATELGRISHLLQSVTALTTPLLAQMSRFARQLTGVILAVSVLVLAVGIWGRGMPFDTTFLAVVSLAVASIPEGLPTILTVAMAIGVTRMAQRHAIVRRLPAVETLGAVSVICSDKTGTLTRNEMLVATLATADGEIRVSGQGYRPDGAFHRSIPGEAKPGVVLPEKEPVIAELARIAILCNESRLQHDSTADTWNIIGDPMEGALLTLAEKAGHRADDVTHGHPRIDSLPFDSRHKFMATLHHDHRGHRLICLKGAPEQVLARCDRQFTRHGEQPLEGARWHAAIEAIAAQGQRVLALAMHRTPNPIDNLSAQTLTTPLCFVGLVGLIDPPRDEAIAAVAECQQAGIRVKMITGDHGTTAQAIARQLGLASTERVLTGQDLDALPAADWAGTVTQVDVFARTTPEHKLRLVETLQANGNVVAMTGDGVNDAPALKRADVGVAMGGKGTDTAREASEMVLTDDNFASIVAAVHEGRTVYDNLRKAITFLLPINGGESLSIILAILIGLSLPIEPLQILWVNMVSSVGLALALAFEPAEPGVMRRPPRDPLAPLLSRFLLWRILLVSVLFTLGIFGTYQGALLWGYAEDTARTLAVNTLVAMEVGYLFSVRYLHRGSFSLQGIMGTRPVLLALMSVVLAQLTFTYVPFMNQGFNSAPLSLPVLMISVGLGAAVFILLELEKMVLRTGVGRRRV